MGEKPQAKLEARANWRRLICSVSAREIGAGGEPPRASVSGSEIGAGGEPPRASVCGSKIGAEKARCLHSALFSYYHEVRIGRT